MSPPTVDTLRIDELPTGAMTRLWLHLASDGLGQPVRVPVLVARGTRPGPVAGITAAIHGNEVNGIPVIHQLLRRLDLDRLRGTVVAVPVVNVMGFLLHQRRTDDGFDLNHLFPGTPTGRESTVYAWRFFDRVVRHLDLLLDLHTASFGRVNCLYVRADMTNPDTARMAYLQRPQVIVHNAPHDGTLRGATADLGIPAVTVEIGNPHRFQREYVKRTTVGLRAVLGAWKMIPKRPVKLGEPPIICSRSAWMYTDRGGLLSVLPPVLETVEAGTEVARLVDPFGDLLRTYPTPGPGVVIGKSVDPVASTGARILHLGTLATDDSDLIPREESP